MAKAKESEAAAAREPALKRLGGGRWQTRDERFTIEPQSGTWVVVDSEQTDDLGLALVRGPFRSLTDAKAGIEAARGSDAPASPLAGRGVNITKPATRAATGKRSRRAPGPAEPAEPAEPTEPAKPPEPRWITELTPADRRRARRTIATLEAAGVRDGEGIVRRDLVGEVPAIAAAAIIERLAEAIVAAGDEATDHRAATLAADVVRLLTDGHDAALDVRWRLVDDGGRAIHVPAADVTAAIDRKRKGNA